MRVWAPEPLPPPAPPASTVPQPRCFQKLTARKQTNHTESRESKDKDLPLGLGDVERAAPATLGLQVGRAQSPRPGEARAPRGEGKEPDEKQHAPGRLCVLGAAGRHQALRQRVAECDRPWDSAARVLPGWQFFIPDTFSF